MLNVPAPTRIPLGTIQLGGQKFELFLSPEWARYFQSLNAQVQANGASLAQGNALTALLDDARAEPDVFPAPPGPRGMQGDPGLALFMLQDDPGETQMIVPDCSGTLGALGSMSKQQASAVAITGGTIAGLASLATANGFTAATTGKMTVSKALAGDVITNLVNLDAGGYGFRVAGGKAGAGYVASFNTYDGTNVATLTGDGNLALSSLTAGAAAPAVAPGKVAFGSSTATTVGAAGGAAALPATPAGYLIFNNGGTNYKIPFYNT